jgi:phage major head subunit gpT-like protein
MIVPSANFNVFISNVNTMFGEAYSTTPIIHPQFVSTVPCGGSQMVFGWTGMMPKFRPWFGPRVTNEPAPQTYTVVPIPFEDTFSIDQFHLADDMFGIYYRMVPDMARQARRWEEYEIRDLLENAGIWTGAAQNGLDGLSNWSTAHPIDLYDSSKGTYINDFTGGGQNVVYTKPSGTTTTLVGGAISPTAFLTLWGYMSTLKGEDNEALGVTPNLLMHHPILNGEVQLLLKSTFFASWRCRQRDTPVRCGADLESALSERVHLVPARRDEGGQAVRLGRAIRHPDRAAREPAGSDRVRRT